MAYKLLAIDELGFWVEKTVTAQNADAVRADIAKHFPDWEVVDIYLPS